MNEISPNTLGAATEHTPVNPLDNSIAEKMSAMRAQRDAERKQSPIAGNTETGSVVEAQTTEPVATDHVEDIVEPEDSNTESEVVDSTEESYAPHEEVSDAGTDSTASELIDFIEFTESNPNAKFKFVRNGKEVIIDAKKAAAILGQGGAIHEEARELKVQKAEFEEYQKEQRARQEGLALAMEFTVQPQLKKVYDEIREIQGYQSQFQQMLAQTTDYAERIEIEANMETNQRALQERSQLIAELRPRIDEFQKVKREQVEQILEHNRKQFKDKELRNSYVYNELREKVSKDWPQAKQQIVPGVDNIDLISSDEHILSLIRDGLKYRDRPKSTSASTTTALQPGKKVSVTQGQPAQDPVNKLREQANKGDRKAAQNLLELRMSQIRAGRR